MHYYIIYPGIFDGGINMRLLGLNVTASNDMSGDENIVHKNAKP